MKKTIVFTCLITFILVTQSMAQARLSNSSRIFLTSLEKMKTDVKSNKRSRSQKDFLKELKRSFPIKKEKTNLYYIGGMMQTATNFDEQRFLDIGGKIGTKTSVLTTFRIPMDKLEAMTRIEGINYIEVDRTVKKKLDKANEDCNVPQVHQGVNLPQSYSGKDVVIGVLDMGFQFSHPTFRDENGDLRIRKVWAQAIEEGSPPADFGYGTEITDPEFLLELDATSNMASHGTHVSSIAGGRGYDGAYRGVAYDADLVFVDVDPITLGPSSLVDAISYVFQYAESVGKPAVINMSLGIHFGPHDGTSLFDQFIDSAVGPGRVIVGSAGNEGMNQAHIGYALQPNDSLQTLIGSDGFGGGADIWGEVGSTYSVGVSITDYSTGTLIGKIPPFQSSIDTIALFSFNNDSIFVEVAVESASPFNNKSNITISYEYLDPEVSGLIIPALIIKGEEGFVHAWNEFSFFNFEFPGFTNGDNDISVGEISGTANGIISVGAYTTTTSYEDLNGVMQGAAGSEEGAIAPFTSHGPTVDGRTKPEITAPGDVVIAAINSQHIGFEEIYPPAAIIEEGEQAWFFAGSSGTSMSSPMTAGIVALLLEANPELSAQEVKEILMSSARTDNFTGTIPASGDNIWGWGKIDALAALMATVPTTACTAPTINTVELQSPRKTRVTWSPVEGASQYLFQIRFKGMTNWLLTAKIRSAAVSIFAPANRTYEFRIAAKCGEETSAYGPIQEYTSSELTAPVFAESRNNGSDNDEIITINNSEFRAFPNPVTNLLTVEYESTSEGILSIHHVSGVKVAEIPMQINTNFYQVNMNQFNDGYYLLRIEESGKMPVNQQIIKQSFKE